MKKLKLILNKRVPELPEVETTVRELKQHILGRKIKDVWSDFPKIVKQPKSFGEFKEKIIGRKIEKIWRRAKNIIIDLSGNNSMLIHQKLTGHLLVGKWQNMKGVWRSAAKGPLEDSVNRFLHLIFWLDDGTMLALSDLRKFAKVELWDSKRLQKSEWINSLGPEPLEKSFSFQVFEEVIKKKKGKIKQILMDQAVISGIGNIYSDEILWQAKVHPLRLNLSLRNKELESIYRAMKEILEQAIKLKGDSMSDYRLISGEKGGYQNIQKVYQQEGNDCQRKDGGIIKRIKIGGRSSRFCPKCQLLTNF